MVCPACGTAFEGRFCFSCGWDSASSATPAPSSPTAPRVEETPPSVPVPLHPAVPPSSFFEYRCLNCGSNFVGWSCPACGAPYGRASSVAGLRAVGSVVCSLGTVAFLVLLAVNLVAFAYASSLILQGAAGGPRLIPLYLLVPLPPFIVGDSVDADATTFLAYFALVAATIVAAYAWFAVRDTKPTLDAFRRPLLDLKSRIESRSAWIVTGQVFLAALFFQVVYAMILEAAGVPVSGPTGAARPEWYSYFALANASVYEEFVTRWMFIGVPLFVWAVAFGPTTPPGNRVPAWRHLFGGTVNRDSPRNLIVLAMILVVASSVIFGLAHVPAWGWWKFLPAMVAGLGMGYLFVRRGFLAGVLFHFATDYLAATALLTQNDIGAQILIGLFVLILVGLGAFFFVWYFVYAAGLGDYWAVKWGFRAPTPAPATSAMPPAVYDGPIPWWLLPFQRAGLPPPPQSPPTYGSPPLPSGVAHAPHVPRYVGGFPLFACPRCAWREAKYDGGRFTCLHCGHVSS